METKLRLIELIEKHKSLHLRELSRLLKTGLPNIVRYVNILEKENVIKKEKEANLVKVSLTAGERTIAYLGMIHAEAFLHLPEKVRIAIKDFMEELETKSLLVLVFGSYAKSNFLKDSDIDILLVFQKVEKESQIESAARRVSLRTGTKISPVYLNYDNFEINFLNKDHDFSREIRQNVIVLRGIDFYYLLLWRFLS